MGRKLKKRKILQKDIRKMLKVAQFREKMQSKSGDFRNKFAKGDENIFEA